MKSSRKEMLGRECITNTPYTDSLLAIEAIVLRMVVPQKICPHLTPGTYRCELIWKNVIPG